MTVSALRPQLRRFLAQKRVSGRTFEQVAMDEEEYLARNGFPEGSRPTASFIRATKGMSGIALKRAQQQHLKDLKDYDANRERLRKEYRAKVQAGEIRPKGPMERHWDTAHGHPDNPAVQAARRILTKRGLWSDALSRKADSRFEAVSTASMGSVTKDTHNLILANDYEDEEDDRTVP